MWDWLLRQIVNEANGGKAAVALLLSYRRSD
jgi:hypothetical protein